MNRLSPPDRETLASLQRMAVTGRLAEAELELHAWVRRGGPTAARVLLASLLARREDYAAALDLLGNPARSQPTEMDPEQAMLTVAVMTAAGLDDDARRLSAWLYHQHGHDPAIARWIAVMDLPGLNDLPGVPDATVERLASELAAQPQAVASLVYASKHAPRTRSLSLLRAAVTRMMPDFVGAEEEPKLCQAVAELAHLLGDEDEARRWAHRGLRLDPFNAVLAMLLGQLDDDEAVGPPAAETLRRVAMKFPHYPDVQAAYTRRLELDRMRVA